MPCLQRHYYFLSRRLFPVRGHTDCALVLYLDNYNAIKSYCPITVKTIIKNSVTQFSPNHYHVSLRNPSSIECRCPGYKDRKTINPPLALITLLKGLSIFTPDFIILQVISFPSKVRITLWGYIFDPCMNLSVSLFNFILNIIIQAALHRKGKI